MKQRNRFKFLFCQLIYHSLCISGLIWQIIQISVIFFKFDTIKDINVFTAEELQSQDKIVYICFYFHDEPIWTEDWHHFLKMSYAEQFRISRDTEHWFAFLRKAELIDELIAEGVYCRKFNITMGSTIGLDRSSGIFYLSITIGLMSHPFDKHRLIGVKTNWKNNSQEYVITSHSFTISKLTPPYTDNCFNYPDIGLENRNDAVAMCDSNATHLAFRKVVRKNDSEHSNYKQKKKRETNCDQSKFKVDCDQSLFITQVVTNDHHDEKNSTMVFPVDTQASFSVMSQPRIDNIDFVTYILGAFGSWVGFSFIGINPVPFFMRKKNDSKRRTFRSHKSRTINPVTTYTFT